MTTWGMSGWSWADQYGGGGGDDDENEEESNYSASSQWAQKDGLIFLIDCSAPMFEKAGDTSSNFDLCIKCCQNVMQEKIIASEKDLLGVVFFATEKHKNSGDFKNIYVLQELNQPGADEVLSLEGLLKDVKDKKFNDKYGHSSVFSLSEALWTCSNMFSNCSKKLGSKRIMLFTCNDDPHAGNEQLKKQAQTKAADLQETGIELDLMHMHVKDQMFLVENFYKDLLSYGDEEMAQLQDPAERFEELLTRVRAKDHKKRAYTKIPLSLGTGLEMSVGVYNLVRASTKPTHVKLYKKTNEEVKTVTRYFKDAGDLLMPHNMKKAQDWAGRTISFEVDELNQIKKFDAAGLSLMGFKPNSCLKRYYHIKPAQFIYPEESIIEGSTTLFSALLKKCLEREVVAICRYIPRKNTPPRFVALMPQEEEMNEDNVQVTPPGFHVIFLPFADDFRKIKFAETSKANADQIDKAKEIVKKLKFPFSSENFENPNLQNYYRNVEALALDRDAPEQLTDHTLPDEDRIEKRAGKLIEEFKANVFPAGYDPSKKRKAPGGAGGAAKSAKSDPSETVDLKKEAESGRLSKLTVAALKECVKTAGIKASGTKKADLISAINKHFGIA